MNNSGRRIKSIVGTGAVTLNVDIPECVGIAVLKPNIGDTETFGTGLVYEGIGPNFTFRTLTGINNASVTSNTTTVIINTSSTTLNLTSVDTGTNLVYDSTGPSVQTKALSSPNDDILTINTNTDGTTVRVGLRHVGLQSGTTQSIVVPNTWYLTTYNSMIAEPVSTSPYWSSTLGTASPNWTTSLAASGKINGTYAGTSGNDDAYIRLDFAVPNTVLPNLSNDQYVLLSIFGYNGTSIVNLVADQYFYMTPNGENLLKRNVDGYGVGQVSIQAHTGTPQFVIGALHNMNANVVFGSGIGNLEYEPVGMLENPGESLGLRGSRLLVQKFR